MCHHPDISDPSDSLDQVEARIVADQGKEYHVYVPTDGWHKEYLPLIPFGIEYLAPMDQHDFKDYLKRKEESAIHYASDE